MGDVDTGSDRCGCHNAAKRQQRHADHGVAQVAATGDASTDSHDERARNEFDVAPWFLAPNEQGVANHGCKQCAGITLMSASGIHHEMSPPLTTRFHSWLGTPDVP